MPPKSWRKHPWHWLGSERSSNPCLVEYRDGLYYSPNEKGGISPQEVKDRGWFWWAPALPPLEWKGKDFNGNTRN